MDNIKTRRITETPELESLTDATNVLVEDGGKVKRVPAKELIPEVPEMPEIPEQIQADLAENDETNPAHVKNRILWVEKKETEILPETVLVMNEEEPGEYYITENAPTLEIGKTYIANWNGVEYKCVAIDFHDMFSDIPKGTAIIAPSEDFVMEDTAGIALTYMAEQKAFGVWDDARPAEGTLFVKCVEEIVHKLPMKFLPNGYPYTEEGFVEILPEQEVTFEAVEELGGLFAAVLTPKKNVLDGTYLFTFDGVEYVCKSVLADDMPPTYALGNEALMGGTNDTGEPFAMMAAENIQMMVVKEAGTFKVGIKAEGEIVHPIDAKLLPEGYPSFEGYETVELLPETTLEGDPEMNNMAFTPASIELVPGETYIVTWNGKVYETVPYEFAMESEIVTMAGNGSVLGGSVGSDEPFFMMISYLEGQSMLIVAPADGSTSFTIKIEQRKKKSVKKMDDDFLPDWVRGSKQIPGEKLPYVEFFDLTKEGMPTVYADKGEVRCDWQQTLEFTKMVKRGVFGIVFNMTTVTHYKSSTTQTYTHENETAVLTLQSRGAGVFEAFGIHQGSQMGEIMLVKLTVSDTFLALKVDTLFSPVDIPGSGSSTNPISSIALSSPNGTKYLVGVNDDGTVATRKLPEYPEYDE